jgi:hypothetical protein
MKTRWALASFFFVLFFAGCTVTPDIEPTVTPAPSQTTSFTSTPTKTATAVPTPTEKAPLTLVFYGDSALKVGEVGAQGQGGFSFVDNLRPQFDRSNNKDHPNAEKMYTMDNMHPGSHGAELIAEGWLQAFKDSQIH